MIEDNFDMSLAYSKTEKLAKEWKSDHFTLLALGTVSARPIYNLHLGTTKIGKMCSIGQASKSAANATEKARVLSLVRLRTEDQAV